MGADRVGQQVADDDGGTRRRSLAVRELPSFAVADGSGSLLVDNRVTPANAPLPGLLSLRTVAGLGFGGAATGVVGLCTVLASA